jgi:hypothetical protein
MHDRVRVRKDGALAGAAVSAAVGLAVYGLRKALAEGGRRVSSREQDAGDEPQRAERRSLLLTLRDSAFDALLPRADDAAEAAGRWAAAKTPALIRERLLPRFIDAFDAAAPDRSRERRRRLSRWRIAAAGGCASSEGSSAA